MCSEGLFSQEEWRRWEQEDLQERKAASVTLQDQCSKQEVMSWSSPRTLRKLRGDDPDLSVEHQ